MEEVYKWCDIVDHHKLFSTHLFVFDNFLDGVQHKADVEDMKCYISTAWNKRDYDNNWQTKSANLQHQSEFKLFSDTITQSNKDILKLLNYNVEDVTITDMWANVLKPGEGHPPHTHSNNFLSGVYYLYSDRTAGITFQDPRAQADIIVPRKKEKNLDNSNLAFYASKTNRAIIFPAWLYHWVPINKSTKNRISISWNIQIKGQLGEHHEFQSANF